MYSCKLFFCLPEGRYSVDGESPGVLDYGPTEVTLPEAPRVGMTLDLTVDGIPLDPASFLITAVELHFEATEDPVLYRGDLVPAPARVVYWCTAELQEPRLGARVVSYSGGKETEVHVDFIDGDRDWCRSRFSWDEVKERAKKTRRMFEE